MLEQRPCAFTAVLPVFPFRAQLSLQPVTEGDEQYERSESFSYDEVSQKPDECIEKTCHHPSNGAHVFKVNMVPLRDTDRESVV